MRLSAILAVAAASCAAAETHAQSPLDYAKEQAQHWFDKISSFIPTPSKQMPVDEAAAKVAGGLLTHLTLDNWEHTIRSNVKRTDAQPEEWWILLSGRNKTCFGRCDDVESAFNKTTALLAPKPKSPHMALVNCDDQPVLCHSWGSGPPVLWILQVPHHPASVDMRKIRLNTTSTTVSTFTDLHTTASWKEQPLYDGYFHPFDGPLAKYGLSKPLAYVIWGFSVVPSWLLMIVISFGSRTIM